MKVAWLNEHLLDWNGGIYYIHSTCSRLGYPVDMVVTKASLDNIKRFTSVGIGIKQFSGIAADNALYWIFYPLFLVINAFKLKRILKDYNAVVSTSPTTTVLCWMIGIHPVVMVFEINPWLYNNEYVSGLTPFKRIMAFLARIFMKPIDRRAHDNASILFCWSESVKKNIEKVYSNNIRVLYGGVDSNFFHKKLPHKGNMVLHVATYLIPMKGTEYAVRAMKYVPNAELVVVNINNDQQERNRLMSIAEELGVKLNFVDEVSDLADFYSLATVLAQPSFDENVHYPVAEAAFCECPAVAFSGKYLSEDIVDGKTGIIVPSGDTLALGQAITNLILNPVLRDIMGKQAKEFAMKRFSWKNHIECYKGAMNVL